MSGEIDQKIQGKKRWGKSREKKIKENWKEKS